MFRFKIKTLLLITTAVALICYRLMPSPPLTLKTLPGAPLSGGFLPLAVGYRGSENRVSTIGSNMDDSATQEFEYTCVSVYRTSDNAIHRELTGPAPNYNHFTGGALLLKSIPEFETIEQFTTVQEFEQIFGNVCGIQDAWEENGTSQAVADWRGCVIVSDYLRVVSVVAHFTDNGEGWQISSRAIREGEYRSTGKKPIGK